MNRRLVALALAASLAAPAAVLTPASAADPAPVPEVVLAPVLDSLTPAVNGWRPTRVKATFSGVDPGPVQCSIDTGAWTPCVDGVLTTPALSHGSHTLRARMAYGDVVGPELAVPVKVDAYAPSVSAAKATKFAKPRLITAKWSGKDAHSGVGSYQVAIKRFSPATKTAAWTYPSTLSRLTKPSASILVSRGQTLCWIVRPKDKVGNVGAWSSRRCTASLIDERSVARSKGWTKKKAKRAFLGTYVQTKKDRASFTLPKTRAAEVAIVMTTCPVCGAVDYYVNGKLIDIIDTYSRKTKYGVVKTFRTKSKGKPVTVKVVASTFGFVPVKIEGFGLYRY